MAAWTHKVNYGVGHSDDHMATMETTDTSDTLDLVEDTIQDYFGIPLETLYGEWTKSTISTTFYMAHIFYINDLHNMKRSLYKMS
jgi:hypothetical protein